MPFPHPLSVVQIDAACTIQQTDGMQYLLRVSCMEIYNETITDLLDTTKVNLKIKENYDGEIGVRDLTEQPVASPEEVLELMVGAINSRQVAATKMNDTSSRSHTIFRIMIESRSLDDDADGAVRAACLNLVDLAGSERIKNTGAAGDRLKEAGNINKSLLTLGSVIGKLAEGADGAHIPYRDSKLTRILQNSLGGNARTAMICAVTPASEHAEETISSLKFASRAANIKNEAKVNEILDEDAQMKRYQRTIAELEQEVAQLREQRTGTTTTAESSESQEKEELAANLAKQEALYRKQQGEIERLKGLMLQASPGKRQAPASSKSGDRRRTWCPGQDAGSGSGSGSRKASSRRSVGFGLDGTSVLASAKKARRNAGGNDAFGAVSVRDRRSRRSVLLPPPLEQLNEHGKEDVGLLKKRNQVLETKTEDQTKEIAALKKHAAAIQAEVCTLTESLEAKSTVLSEMHTTSTAAANSKAEEYETKIAKIEAGYKDEIVQLKENQGFMQEELDVWQSAMDDEESKMDRLISPSRLTKAENDTQERLAIQETQHKELVKFLEDTIKNLEEKNKSMQLTDEAAATAAATAAAAEALTTEIAELKAKHQDTEELKAKHEAEMVACKMQEDQRVQLESEIAELNTMMDEVSDKNIALDAMLKQKEQDFAAAHAQVEELTANLEQALSTSASLSDSEAKCEATKAALTELEANIASLGETHAEQVAAMTKEMQDSAAESAEAIRFVNVELGECNEKNAQLEAAIYASSEMHQATVDQHVVELAQLEASVQLQADAAAKDADAKSEHTAAELATAKADLEAASSKLADVEARMADASNMHAATLAQLDSAYVELNAAGSASGGAAAGATTPTQSPKKSKIFSAVKNTFSSKKAKKKRKLFKKGAINSPSDDEFNSRSSRPLVDHLVTPAKRSETPVSEEEISTQLFKVQADAQEEVVRVLKIQVTTANEELAEARNVQQTLEDRTDKLESELESLVDMNTLLQSTIDRMTPEDMVREADSAEKRPRDAMTPSGTTPVRPSKYHINDSMSTLPKPLSFSDELATSPSRGITATEEGDSAFVFEGMIDGMTMMPVGASVPTSPKSIAPAPIAAGVDSGAVAAAAANAEEKIATANREIIQLQAKLEDAVLDHASQKAQIEELQANVDGLVAEAAQNVEQLSKLASDAALADTLSNQVKAVQSTLDAALVEVAELTQQKEEVEDTGLDNLEAISSLENKLVEAQADATSYKAQLDSSDELLHATKLELTTVAIRKKELETEYQAVSQSLVEVKVEIETVKVARDAIQEKLAGVVGSLDADRQSMAMEADETIQVLTSKIAVLEAEVAEKQAAFEDIEKSFHETVEAAETDIQNFAATQDKLVASEARTEGLEKRIISTEAMCAEATERANQAAYECAEMKQQREVEMEERDAADRDNSNAFADELLDAQNEISSLNSQIDGMNKEFEQERVAAQNAKAAAKAAAEKMADNIMDAEIGIADHVENINALKKKCAELQENNDSLEKNCSELRDEIDELQLQLAAVQDKLRLQLVASHEKAQTSETTAAEVAEVQAQLEKNNNSLEKNCSELRDEIDELQLQLAAVQDKLRLQLVASHEKAQTSETTAAEVAEVQAQLEKVRRDAEERTESFEATDEYHTQKLKEYEQTMAELQTDLESTQREKQQAIQRAETSDNAQNELASYVDKLEADTKEIVEIKEELMQTKKQLAAEQSKAASIVNISQVTHSGIMDGVAPRVKQSRSTSRKLTTQPKKRVASAVSSATAAAAAPVLAPVVATTTTAASTAATAAATVTKPSSILRATKVTFDEERNEVRSFQPGENETRTPDTSILSPAPALVKVVQPARRALKDKNSSDSSLSARPAKKQVLSMNNPPSTPSSKLQTSWEPAPAATSDGTASKASSILKEAKLARKATSHRSSAGRRNVAQDAVEEDPAECATQ